MLVVMTGSRSRLAAVVFDFDGVIVNTEPLHYAAFQEILKPMGLGFSWGDYVSHYLGFDDRDAFREAHKAAGRTADEKALPGLIDAKARAFQRLAEEKGARPFPGVVPLIGQLSGHVPLALCSGALRRDVGPILGKLNIAKDFDVMVTAEDVGAGKPDPESYVLAVKKLAAAFPGAGIQAERCVAIEDTPQGVDAALAAGLKVLGLSNSYPADRLRAAGRVVGSLKNVSVRDLEGLVGG